uniref:G-protein coupled receptors family 1 profile domain-containing protein n=1 Tax=Cynoglossus semilaevis TaxID=244447 RepID=A0A3P8V5H7_CYNSE
SLSLSVCLSLPPYKDTDLLSAPLPLHPPRGGQPQLPLVATDLSWNLSVASQTRGLGPSTAAASSIDPRRALAVGIVLASFILFAIVGNMLVILAVVCNPHLRTPTNYFIINLAMADLLLGTTVPPSFITAHITMWVTSQSN